MNILGIMRSEITIELILICLFIYICYEYSKGNKHRNNYALLVAAGLCHNTFGLLTEITVNLPAMPEWIRDSSHVLFAISAIFFCEEYYKYILTLILSTRHVRKFALIGYCITLVGIVSIFPFKISYFEGKGTYYSASTGLTICFLCGILMFLTASILLLINFRIVEKKAVVCLVPVNALAVLLTILQLIIKDVFFTETIAVLILFTIFLSSENPKNMVDKKALVDYITGLYNRTCYERDLKRIREAQAKGDKNTSKFKDVAFVMCDLNYLKYINDNFGHLEGDRRIRLASDILLKNMTNAYKLYRVGGDEFIGIYLNENIACIEGDMKKVSSACFEVSMEMDIPLVIAMGHSKLNSDEVVEAAIDRADGLMYENKRDLKTQYGVESR